MISNFFIDRPVAANVIAVITMILGLVALQSLPVERYPSITPPTIQVTATYPGANAQVMADTVARPGGEGTISFGALSATGGVVNASGAIRLAEQHAAHRP